VSLGELLVIVVDQKTRFEVTLRKSPHILPGMLGYPEAIGVSGDPAQVDPSGAHFDVEQLVQCLQPEGFHSEEITGQNLLLVVGYQLPPTDGTIANGSGHDAVPTEDVANTGLGDLTF
jgi:hypothetical protein